MNLFRHTFAPLLALAFAGHAAEPAATVDSVQLPVWRTHAGVRAPLQPGMALESSDIIETGAGARVLLRLGEGSTVKLGESARLELRELTPPATADGIFKGFLDVARGAFRFTTTALGANRRRDINARIATATIGIRGTDVWGKAEPERDFVVLLEGQIDITREQQTVALSEPLTLYMAPRGQPAEPLRPVDGDDLARWAQETELQPGGGTLSADGAWMVQLASVKDEAAAQTLVEKLAAEGYPATTSSAEVGADRWYRIGTAGFVSRAEAAAYAQALKGRFGLSSPWVMAR